MFPGLYFKGDTAYTGNANNYLSTFFSFADACDYLIEVPSTHAQYKIFNVTANHNPAVWEQDMPGSPGSSQARITTYACHATEYVGSLYQATINNLFLPLVK